MTLTQAAVLTKRGLLIFIILLLTTLVAKVGYNIWYQHYLASLPPVEEKPEMKFGLLPKIVFPLVSVSSSNYSYSLDTTTGNLPQTPKLMKVYFIPQSKVSLLAPDRSRQLAENLGFASGPEILSPTQHKFTDNQNGELTIDLPTGNFHFQKKISIINTKSSSSAQITPALIDQNKYLEKLIAFLSNRDLLPDELKNGRSKVTLNENKKDPELAEVSLWPTEIDQYSIVNPTFNLGLVKAKISSLEDNKNAFSQMDYTFWPIDQTTFSTYPIKTAEKAFADLRSGNGFISIEPKNAQVSISSIYLAYFESEQYSPYLQPVFVFEGPNFAALVPAISNNNPN